MFFSLHRQFLNLNVLIFYTTPRGFKQDQVFVKYLAKSLTRMISRT
jgi:hypothetical protein